MNHPCDAHGKKAGNADRRSNYDFEFLWHVRRAAERIGQRPEPAAADAGFVPW